MSGIEKQCEFSGESCGSSMYKWKKDFIQIQPKYKKEFKDVEGVLFWFKDPDIL